MGNEVKCDTDNISRMGRKNCLLYWPQVTWLCCHSAVAVSHMLLATIVVFRHSIRLPEYNLRIIIQHCIIFRPTYFLIGSDKTTIYPDSTNLSYDPNSRSG
jgi:hypothetical protein